LAVCPGVFNRIAVTAPPIGTPPITPPARASASVGSIPKVTGVRRASAVVPPSPGSTPTKSPIDMPIIRKRSSLISRRL
jgi:hypothetical protein